MKKILMPIITALIFTLLLPLHFAAASPDFPDTNLVAADPNSNTLFAYFNGGSRLLFRSDNWGYDWTNTGLGTGLNGTPLSTLEISSAYTDDGMLLASGTETVYKSTDKGESFSVLISLPHEGVGGSITSLAIGPEGEVLVGTSTGTGGGGILLFNGENWNNLNIGAKDVLAVAFSPNYAVDQQVLACTYDGDSVVLENLIAGNAWNDPYPAAVLYTDTANKPQSADLAFPSDYDPVEVSFIFAGVNGGGSGPDLYRVHLSNESNRVTDLDVNGTGTGCNIYSVAIGGTMESGHIAVGLADSNMVKRSATPVGAPVLWSDSTRPPRGTANVGLVYVLVDSPDYYHLYAVTTGPGYGVFYSTDFGDYFYTLLQPVNPIAPVEDLEVVNATVNSISLTWNLTDEIGEGDHFDIRYLESEPVTEDNWDDAVRLDEFIYPSWNGAQQSFTVRGLQPQTTYYFAVKTGWGWSWSRISNSPVGTTLPALDSNPPLGVEDLAVSGTSYSSVSLTWTAPGDPEPNYEEWEGPPFPPDGSSGIPQLVNFFWPWNAEAASYDFQLAGDMSFSNLIASQSNLAEPTWNETAVLDYGTTYSWRERPYYGDGYYGDWVSYAFTTLSESAAHTQYDIRYLTAEINDDNWDAAFQCTGEPLPLEAGAAETFTAGNLASGTTYYFALKTGDGDNNWSILSNCVPGTTRRIIPHPGDYVPPAPVTDLAVIDATSISATLQWTATGDDGHVGKASAYDIRYMETNTLNADTWGSAVQVEGEPSPQMNGTIQRFTVKGLKPEVTYYFAIKAVDDAGNWSLISNIAVGTTPDTTPPDAIADLSVAESGTASITLVWTATGDDGLTGTASQYDLRYTREAGNQNYDSWTRVSGLPAPRPSGLRERYIAGGLDPDTTYYFIIRAADEVPNWSEMSAVVTGRTLSLPAPSPAPLPQPSPSPTPAGETGGGLPDSDRKPYDPPDKTPVSPAPAGPIFAVTSLKVSKDKVSTGETAEVTATIANSGDQAGSYTVRLMVNGLVEKTAQPVLLDPGTNTTVRFEFNKDAAGSYDLQVGEKSSKVQVEQPVRIWIWILVAIAVLLLILLILRQVLHWGFKKSPED